MSNKIVIGTANFGMNYGIRVGQKKLLASEIIDIINGAQKKGIDTLDTAIAYGDSIERLGNIGVQKFKIITKIPRIPKKVANSSDWYKNKVIYTIKKLKINNLEAVLLHYPNDLIDNKNKKLIDTLLEFKKKKIINKIGISIYEKKELEEILKIFKPDLIQCPLNIFDNRLTKNNFLETISKKGIDIHVRSIFLQGLLLLNSNKIPNEFLKYQKLFLEWENWLKLNNLNSLEACVIYANRIKWVNKLVIGINSSIQLNQIIKHINNFSTHFEIPNWQNPIDKNLIDPRKWKKKK